MTSESTLDLNEFFNNVVYLKSNLDFFLFVAKVNIPLILFSIWFIHERCTEAKDYMSIIHTPVYISIFLFIHSLIPYFIYSENPTHIVDIMDALAVSIILTVLLGTFFTMNMMYGIKPSDNFLRHLNMSEERIKEWPRWNNIFKSFKNIYNFIYNLFFISIFWLIGLFIAGYISYYLFNYLHKLIKELFLKLV